MNEPVRISGAINAALVAIWGVVIVVAQIDPTVAGAVTVAIAAVVNAVLTIVTRGKVAPTPAP